MLFCFSSFNKIDGLDGASVAKNVYENLSDLLDKEKLQLLTKADFLDSVSFWRFSPDNSIIVCGTFFGVDRNSAALCSCCSVSTSVLDSVKKKNISYMSACFVFL